MYKIYFISFFSIILFIVGSCSIPEAQAPKKSYVIIASDFLNAKDSVIFKNFEQATSIKVIIKHLSADSIIAHYHYYKYNSKFDAVLLSSSYSMNRLSKLHYLQDLPEQFSEASISLRSPQNDWICIGFDPFVIDFKDSSSSTLTYNELTYGIRWQPVLNKEESAAFYASVIHQFGRKQMNKSLAWLESFKQHQDTPLNDSLKTANFTLNRHSIARQNKHQFILPNQSKGGAFYDGVGIGIIAQSRKYSEMERLISYILIRHNNQGITGKLNIFPIENPESHSDYNFQNSYPKLFRCTPNKCVREYRDMERILMKIK